MSLPVHLMKILGAQNINMFARCYSCGDQCVPDVNLGVIERELQLDLFILCHEDCQPAHPRVPTPPPHDSWDIDTRP